jgi:hypothetical protein
MTMTAKLQGLEGRLDERFLEYQASRHEVNDSDNDRGST